MSTDSLTKSSSNYDFYLQKQLARDPDSPNVQGFLGLAMLGILKMGEIIGPSLYDDDVVADFAGSSGYAAEIFAEKYYIKPIVSDINDEVLRTAATKGFHTRTCPLEKLNFKDGEVDWGFCSHALEHVLDLDKAVSELTRVVKRGLFLVFPLETKESFDKNDQHMRYSTGPDLFIDPFLARGWKVGWEKTDTNPEEYGYNNYSAWLYKEEAA